MTRNTELGKAIDQVHAEWKTVQEHEGWSSISWPPVGVLIDRALRLENAAIGVMQEAEKCTLGVDLSTALAKLREAIGVQDD